MLEKLRKERGDEGFTLIELLVVIIIIGILAAIAIPVFLNQRQKGWEAAVKSDLRNAATAQETYLTESNTYLAGDVAALRRHRIQVLRYQELLEWCCGHHRHNQRQQGLLHERDSRQRQQFSYSSPGGLSRVPAPFRSSARTWVRPRTSRSGATRMPFDP